jgi:thymidine kinase
MAKLHFRYGAMGSSKTLNLLAIRHNYETKERLVILIKPAIDTRYNIDTVKTRAGLEAKADIILYKDTPDRFLYSAISNKKIDCILVDEVQFLEPTQIDLFRTIVDTQEIPIICYGLRTNIATELFPASKRLMEVADTIEEIKTICRFCNKKAIFNLAMIDGKPMSDPNNIPLGFEDIYSSVCSKHYWQHHNI